MLNGKDFNGKQRYRYNDCRCSSRDNPQMWDYSPEQQAVILPTTNAQVCVG